MRLHSSGQMHFDDGGRLAAGGTPVLPLVQAVLADPYFTSPPPKSTDGPAMLAIFQRERMRLKLMDAPLPDLLASACQITAGALVGAIGALTELDAVDCVFAGGGTLNRTLTDCVARLLGSPVRTTDELGVPSQAREAMAFALLGAATLDGVPASLPSVTGARRSARLGSITPPP
jgi:anhydro-N-acetylmuramic acid kinase